MGGGGGLKEGGVQWPNMGILRCRSPNAYGRFETKRLSMIDDLGEEG